MRHPTGGSPDAGPIEGQRLMLEKAFDSLREAVDQCVNEFNRVVNEVNAYRAVIENQPFYYIRAASLALHFIDKNIERIRELLKEPLNLAEEVLQNWVPMVSLFVTSGDYLNTIRGPLHAIAHEVKAPADDNLHYWSGAAASAYQVKQDGQQEAVEASAEFAQAVSEWLFNIGKMNVAYIVRLVQALIDAAMELVNITVNGAAIINIQFAIDDAGDMIAKLVQTVLNELVEIANTIVATIEDYNKMTVEKSKVGLPEGRWPQAVYGNG